ncbi:primosomal protein N' [Gimibacter soli]|uniref:primosomal protein N' n=1 Tax=Gimibacter soli TaxID=3024400 RepID=UPI003EB9892C
MAGVTAESDDMGEARRISVMVPAPLDSPLDYLWAGDMPAPAPGHLVEVPLGKRRVIGGVWDGGRYKGRQVALAKLKPAIRPVDAAPLDAALMKLVDWVAAYTMSAPGMILKMCLSVPEALEGVPVRKHLFWREGLSAPDKLTPARKAVLTLMADGIARTPSEIGELAGVSAAVIKGLEEQGALVAEMRPVDQPFAVPMPKAEGPVLGREQQTAADSISAAVAAKDFAPFLLDGITGSGKTEVYFEGVVEALKDPTAQILVLLPEIALTAQWFDRFADRFGVEPVVWHSDIGQAGRRRAWGEIAAGRARVVVGARSALFLPFRNLRLIIVDEEHDPSYKQEEGVIYHARDMAVVRAKFEACPLVLASATPSMESRVNAKAGRYKELRLTERHGAAELPAMRVIDMRHEGPASGEWIAPMLASAIEDRLGRGEQSMLFLNRRGYAPLTLCRTCGHRIECPACSAWLVEHRSERRLVCHHCGHSMRTPDNCPECDDTGSLVPCGPGVERLQEEVTARFPTARLAVMTSDTLTRPGDMARMVAMIESGALDIVIGTQIVTKGYHFPNLTCVGVIDADLGLRGGDLRAGERTWQQLVQVAGRAGRGDKPGTVFLQSYDPAHPVVAAIATGDGEAFMEAEEAERSRFHMPPFGRLAALVISGPDLAAVVETGRRLARAAPQGDGIHVLGPAPAPLARLRGLHRHRMLVQTGRDTLIQDLVAGWLGRVKPASAVKIRVDIDPYSFM